MSSIRTVLLSIALCLLPATIAAQEKDLSLILEQAEEDYRIGRFEQILTNLQEHLYSFKGNNRQKALRLMALSFMAQDDMAQAENYARQLVELNNYYSNVDDPIRFEELVNRLKSGLVQKVSTASSLSEGINEAPVPVTIITAEMIENLGYNKRLGQILEAYVPGMSEVSTGDTDNMAMHGALSNIQELILVMENGHRLNNRTFNACTMDYSISTEKIDHIEVLRGPASSLYGNVALSAVVNIITKSGSDLNGIKAKYGYGSLKTHKADITIGTRFMDADIFIWGSFYKSSPQYRRARDAEEYENKFFEKPATAYHAFADGYQGPPTYDLGLSVNYKGFSLLYSRKNNMKMSQFSDYGGYYNYDKYKTLNGHKPGNGMEEDHLELGYSWNAGPVTLSATAYGDRYESHEYHAEGPEYDNEEDYDPFLTGYYQYINIKERTIGAIVQASSNYTIGSMTGNLLFGTQLEHFRLTDYLRLIGKEYNEAAEETDTQFLDLLNHENSLSFYAQAKHNFTPKFILNAGLRYDIKNRHNKPSVKDLSPRLALIYTPRKSFSVKLTYAKSFVDMSYYNRIMDIFSMDTEFLPQYLNALQLTVMGKVAPLHLAFDVNVFYNHFKNLYGAISSVANQWVNEGAYKTWGIEASATYRHQRLTAVFNAYWQKDIESSNYLYSESEQRVAAVPRLTFNVNVGWKVLQHESHQLKLYGNAHYTGSKVIKPNPVNKIPDYKVNPTCIFDAGIKYTYKQRTAIAIDCENVFNTDRFLAGMQYGMYPYYQRGRNIMVSASYTF